MSPIVRTALEWISDRSNPVTGLTHGNDKNAAKEMFVRLYEASEELFAGEIEDWAAANGWPAADAKQLAKMGQKIGMGSRPRINEGPYWKNDVIAQLRARVLE